MEGEVFYLYCYTGDLDEQIKDVPEVYNSKLFSQPFSLRVRKKTTREFNDFYTELRWRVASLNNLLIYYICDKDNIIHTSFCTKKSFKFPFMNNNDYHIGPCYTNENYRGRSIYPHVLKYIVSEIRKNPNAGNIYMIISEDNNSSRKGVTKAGFSEVAILNRKGILKRYYVKKWLR